MNKTLIFDFSQIAHATFHSQVRFDKDLKGQFEQFAFHKYLMLSSILKTKKKYNPDEIIIATDKKSWRKDFFPYYKARRAMKKTDLEFDVQLLYDAIEEMIAELKENFPYKVIEVDKAEGDDVIAVLTQELVPYRKNIIIASRDKDFKQLLKYKNVTLYDAIEDAEIECENPQEFILEHILVGDSGDDIPNLLSDDKVFITQGKRQKPCTAKVKREYFENPEKYAIDNGLIDNWERNKKLITLDIEVIPVEIVEGIKQCYFSQKQASANAMQLLKYFRQKKMQAFADAPEQFLI